MSLDEELLRGGAAFSEWFTFIANDADIAFVHGAHLAAIFTAAAETYLRAEYCGDPPCAPLGPLPHSTASQYGSGPGCVSHSNALAGNGWETFHMSVQACSVHVHQSLHCCMNNVSNATLSRRCRVQYPPHLPHT